jgi:Na+/H+ antiporter NhaA
VRTPLRSFLRTETGGAAVLLAAALAALAWVNADASSYDSFWHTKLSIEVGSHGVSLTLRDWVNSGLMTFFFFVVGLEARREFEARAESRSRLADPEEPEGPLVEHSESTREHQPRASGTSITGR